MPVCLHPQRLASLFQIIHCLKMEHLCIFSLSEVSCAYNAEQRAKHNRDKKRQHANQISTAHQRPGHFTALLLDYHSQRRGQSIIKELARGEIALLPEDCFGLPYWQMNKQINKQINKTKKGNWCQIPTCDKSVVLNTEAVLHVEQQQCCAH